MGDNNGVDLDADRIPEGDDDDETRFRFDDNVEDRDDRVGDVPNSSSSIAFCKAYIILSNNIVDRFVAEPG